MTTPVQQNPEGERNSPPSNEAPASAERLSVTRVHTSEEGVVIAPPRQEEYPPAPAAGGAAPGAGPTRDSTVFFAEESEQYHAIALSHDVSSRGGYTGTAYAWVAKSGTWVKDMAWAHASDIGTGITVAVQSVGTAMTAKPHSRDRGEIVAIIGTALNGAKGLDDFRNVYQYLARREDGEFEVVPDPHQVRTAAMYTAAGGVLNTASAVMGALGEAKLFNDTTRASLKTAALVGAYAGSLLSLYGPKTMNAAHKTLGIKTWLDRPVTSSPLPMSRNASVAAIAGRSLVSDAEGNYHRQPVRESAILPAVHSEQGRGGGHTRK